MYHFFAGKDQLFDDGKKIVISGDDFNHMVNVLRMKIGEEFSVSIKDDDDFFIDYGRLKDKTESADSELSFSGLKEYRFGILSIDERKLIGELRFIKEAKERLGI